MTSWYLWMMTGGLMTEQELINFKLELARAWIQNGQEDLARGIITKIINDGVQLNNNI